MLDSTRPLFHQQTDDTARDHPDQASPVPINTSSDVELIIVLGPLSVGSSVCLAHRAHSLRVDLATQIWQVHPFTLL